MERACTLGGTKHGTGPPRTGALNLGPRSCRVLPRMSGGFLRDICNITTTNVPQLGRASLGPPAWPQRPDAPGTPGRCWLAWVTPRPACCQGRGSRGPHGRLSWPRGGSRLLELVSRMRNWGKQGQVTCQVQLRRVRGQNPTRDLVVDVPGKGEVVVDIGYGGAFYAFVDAKRFGLDVCSSKTRDLVDAATAVTEAVKVQVKIHHPDSEDLAFLYGTILTDGKDAFTEEPTTNICVFADAQVDRSPTGSGVTARIALQYHKGLIQLNQTRTFKSSTTGSLFTGKPVKETKCGEFKAVVVEVSGQAYYTGAASFIIEEEDPLKNGFLLK
ncbi:trans-3-hydroxy-L-proline dehydratase isoform X3 [Macrotis lagotis]|uniref:trans-3-hydroxy-L-proline dehydratase isoform X3 n=1 Tax=Macrotis lagotis TaxID=92651 RepID=UPI003D685DD0